MVLNLLCSVNCIRYTFNACLYWFYVIYLIKISILRKGACVLFIIYNLYAVYLQLIIKYFLLFNTCDAAGSNVSEKAL